MNKMNHYGDALRQSDAQDPGLTSYPLYETESIFEDLSRVELTKKFRMSQILEMERELAQLFERPFSSQDAHAYIQRLCEIERRIESKMLPRYSAMRAYRELVDLYQVHTNFSLPDIAQDSTTTERIEALFSASQSLSLTQEQLKREQFIFRCLLPDDDDSEDISLDALINEYSELYEQTLKCLLDAEQEKHCVRLSSGLNRAYDELE